MHLVKFTIAFLAVGGTTYALFKLNDAPGWLKAISVLMALAAILAVLPELPRGVEALRQSGRLVSEIFSAQSAPLARHDSVNAVRRPQEQAASSPMQCAAIAMSNTGGWGGSAGAGLSCPERLERAHIACKSILSDGQCSSHAMGWTWVAGVHCLTRVSNEQYRNSFVRSGESEAIAFENAFAAATINGFDRESCRRKIAISSEEGTERRY